jgi:hypothetical protein
LTKPGTRHFGRTTVSIGDKAEWKRQDHSKSWDTPTNEVDAALQEAGKSIKKLIASEVRDGVTEYMATAESSVCIDGGDIMVGIRVWNDHASVIVHVPLHQLLTQAVKDAAAQISSSDDAQVLVSKLIVLGREMVSLQRAPSSPPRPETMPDDTPRQAARRRATNGRAPH